MRTVASTVIVTFLMLILEPTAMAAQLPEAPAAKGTTKAAGPAMAQTATPEGKLSHALQSTQTQLRHFQDTLTKKQDFQADKAVLKQLRQDLKTLDKTIRADFNTTGVHLKAHKLPAVI